MALSAAHMIALAYDSAFAHDNGTNHRVWLGVLPAIGVKLQTPTHEEFIAVHLAAKVRKGCWLLVVGCWFFVRDY